MSREHRRVLQRYLSPREAPRKRALPNVDLHVGNGWTGTAPVYPPAPCMLEGRRDHRRREAQFLADRRARNRWAVELAS